jgi:hypothetical protein
MKRALPAESFDEAAEDWRPCRLMKRALLAESYNERAGFFSYGWDERLAFLLYGLIWAILVAEFLGYQPCPPRSSCRSQ